MYIATPTPLLDTLADFWQMIWEQSSVVIVCLERPADLKPYTEQLLLDSNNTNNLADECIQYWPNEGTYAYGNFEVSPTEDDKFFYHIIKKNWNIIIPFLWLPHWQLPPNFGLLSSVFKSRASVHSIRWPVLESKRKPTNGISKISVTAT